MRILIAEDDRVSATIIERIVAKVGFPCETVSDGRQAVERLAEKSFDIVLTDWMMPEMDGIALVRHIRGRPGPQPLIVMITAVSTHGALDHAMESGADDFLAKPVDASQVLKSIRTLIRRRRQATPTLPKKTAAGPTATKWEAAKPVASAPPAPYVAVVIGASTGGPAALQTVFESLPSNAASAAFFLVLHGPVWMLKSYPRRWHVIPRWECSKPWAETFRNPAGSTWHRGTDICASAGRIIGSKSTMGRNRITSSRPPILCSRAPQTPSARPPWR